MGDDDEKRLDTVAEAVACEVRETIGQAKAITDVASRLDRIEDASAGWLVALLCSSGADQVSIRTPFQKATLPAIFRAAGLGSG
jgi:hypothetical protein